MCKALLKHKRREKRWMKNKGWRQEGRKEGRKQESSMKRAPHPT
jgi:hypothetical protein